MYVTYVDNYVLAPKNIAENIYVEKTYHIRKVGGGGGVRQGSEKKKASVGLFSTFRHPLGLETNHPSLNTLS